MQRETTNQRHAETDMHIVNAINLKGFPQETIERILDEFQQRKDKLIQAGKKAEISCDDSVLILMTN